MEEQAAGGKQLRLRCLLYRHRFRSVPDVDVIETTDGVTGLVSICTVPPHVAARR